MQEEISFGVWLRKQRHALDLSRQSFANQVGCAEVTLRRIEAGTLKPSKDLANLLLEKLGIAEHQRPQWISFARGLSGFPPEHRSLSNKPKSNLPASLTTFIGRKKEQSDVIKLITNHRLVTLTGPGGVGKTSLSIRVGEQVLGNYADGLWLVELASLSNPVLIAQTFAALFGLTTQSTISFTDLLINFLRAKSILLIVDNCEHLLDACAHLIDTLLKSCPHLKILATSREPLGITGEAIYLVPSLELPDLQQLIDTFRDFESVRLFEERAQLAQYDYFLTLENAASVAQICQRLDGIPLAIELAAAKVGILSTEQIAKQLDESFNVLTGGSRTALPRHQTLRASMNWSWGLLTEAEQTLMRQLSVFAGGWTLEAAQAVCDGQVLELTNSLVKKSLIVMNGEADRDTRYRFHEIVRQYTHEKLVAVGEEEKPCTRHMKYFLLLAEQAEPELRGPTQMQWYARLRDERDNIRTALGWADKTDVEAGLYLSSRLVQFWYIFDLREGNYWLSRFLQRSESSAYPEARAKGLYTYALILEDMQQFDEARSAAEECLKLFRALGNQEGEIDGLLVLAWDAWTTASERTELMQQALELAQSLGDVPRQVEALLNLGYSDQSNNRFTYWEEAIELSRSLGDARGLASSLSHIGFYLALCGHIESAQKHLDEADMLYQKFHMNPPPRDLLSAHGQIALIRRDYEKARTYFQESARIHAEFGNQHEYFEARVRLGYVALQEGKLAEARHILIETAQNFQKDKYAMGVAFALDGIANICLTLNKTDYAAHLIGWADGIHEKMGDLRPVTEQTDVDKVIVECIAKMGKAKFSEAYEEGKKMSLDEAVAYALES